MQTEGNVSWCPAKLGAASRGSQQTQPIGWAGFWALLWYLLDLLRPSFKAIRWLLGSLWGALPDATQVQLRRAAVVTCCRGWRHQSSDLFCCPERFSLCLELGSGTLWRDIQGLSSLWTDNTAALPQGTSSRAVEYRSMSGMTKCLWGLWSRPWGYRLLSPLSYKWNGSAWRRPDKSFMSETRCVACVGNKVPLFKVRKPLGRQEVHLSKWIKKIFSNSLAKLVRSALN